MQVKGLRPLACAKNWQRYVLRDGSGLGEGEWDVPKQNREIRFLEIRIWMAGQMREKVDWNRLIWTQLREPSAPMNFWHRRIRIYIEIYSIDPFLEQSRLW